MTNIVTSSGLRKSLSRATTAMLLVLGIASRAAAGDEPARLLLGMEAAYARVHGYTARFVRQEVVDGELRPREEALLKFRRPGLIYLRWVAGPPVGRQILFVPGKNHDRMLVREPGLPVRAVMYDWDDRTVADYAYREVRLNPPLTRTDFDPANPEYGFPHWRVAR